MRCIFPVPDLKKTADCCRSVPGISAVGCLDCAEPHICLYRDGAELILPDSSSRPVQPNRVLCGYGCDACLYACDQDALEKEFRNRQVRIVRSLQPTDCFNRELVIEDCDGRWIAFALKPKPSDLFEQ